MKITNKEKIPGTQLIARTCGLLKLFNAQRTEMSLIELAELSSLHTATAYRILQALVLEGFLNHDPATGRYRLGLGLLRLGEVAKSSNDLYRISFPWVKKLAEQWRETVALDSMLPTFEIVRVLAFPSTYLISSNPHLHDFVPPPHSFAAGKLLLAYASQQDVEAYVSQGLESFTRHTITDPLKLSGELSTIRQQGFATNFGEQEEGFNAVACPIRDVYGKVIAGVSLGGPSSRINQESLPPILDSVLQTCKSISADLGYIESASVSPHTEEIRYPGAPRPQTARTKRKKSGILKGRGFMP
jgi:DNA-binding IclR family transcriptional regulator